MDGAEEGKLYRSPYYIFLYKTDEVATRMFEAHVSYTYSKEMATEFTAVWKQAKFIEPNEPIMVLEAHDGPGRFARWHVLAGEKIGWIVVTQFMYLLKFSPQGIEK